MSLRCMGQPNITNSIGMQFVRIDPGTVVIGEFNPPYPVPDDTVKSLPHDYIMWMGDGRSYNADEFRLAKEMAMRRQMRSLKKPAGNTICTLFSKAMDPAELMHYFPWRKLY